MQFLLSANYSLFIGRFHPLLVHLPIGFLLLAALLEWWPGDKVRPAIRVSWVLGALSAVAAVVCGWLLAGESGGGDTLWWHKWLGISVATLAVAGVFVTNKGGRFAKGFGVLVATLLALAGHQGGNLTHGEDYLWRHAPAAVQKLAGHEPAASQRTDWETVNTDSINLYAEFIRPALNTSCVKCHNAGKQNGGLRMDAAHHLFAGGDGGPILVAGNPLGSSWAQRVTLPRDNVKAMPPQGKPWDYTTIKLLEYWIEQGADTLAVLDPQTTPEPVKQLLLRDHGLDLRPKLFVEKMQTAPVRPEVLAQLDELHWSVTSLRPDGSALEVKPSPGHSPDAAALGRLADLAAEQVAYLSLERLPLTDAELDQLVRFPNLNRLRLNGTGVTATTVARLAKMPHLESLNLYDTAVGNDIFPALQRFPALRRLYLWRTQVSPGAVADFEAQRPGVDVDTGFSFTLPAESTK